MTPPNPNPRWYHLTPARFFIGLLVVQVFLFLSEWFKWFAFNEKRGWTLLIAVGVVGLAVLVMLVRGLVCVCFRRRFQFGVRSLLLCVVAVSVPLGWFAWEMERARRQREAVEVIVGKGGSIFYDYEIGEEGHFIPHQETLIRRWSNSLFGPDFCADVVEVVCFRCDHGNDVASYVKRLPEVEFVTMAETQFDDTGLAHLRGATKLRKLQLSDVLVTDDGLTYVKQLSNLESLALNRTQITDAGLRDIEDLTRLTELNLIQTKVTNVGLVHLKRLTSLRELFLGGTQVTDEGVKKLQQALPDCRIFFAEPPLPP
jgi:hypothetical protein